MNGFKNSPESSLRTLADDADLANQKTVTLQRDTPKSGKLSIQLTKDVHKSATKRLAICALVYSVTYATASAPGHIGLLVSSGHVHLPSVIMTALSITFGLVVFFLGRKNLILPHQFNTLAISVQVSGAVGIAANFWNLEHTIYNILDYTAFALGLDVGWMVDNLVLHEARIVSMYGGVTWVGVWVAIFPLIVPMPVKRVLVAGLISVMVTPIVLIASRAANGLPSSLQEWWLPVLVELSWPVFVCAGIGVLASQSLYRIALALSKERQVGGYRLVEPIGVGGMGEVWRAAHRFLARPAAIKLIRPEVLSGSDADANSGVRRFEREALATSRLSSPHTVALYDFGVTDTGSLYYVMEFLRGLDLDTLVRRYGPVDEGRVVHYLIQACESLSEAHQNDLIHRDIKPANIFTCKIGITYDFVKVLDFGLVADRSGWEQEPDRITVTGAITGTPTFAAPEQIAGGVVDERTDIYGLGCVAYWLLTGKGVFDASNLAVVLGHHLHTIPETPSRRLGKFIPGDLEKIVMDCLEKDPGNRPQSAGELAARLNRCSVAGSWTTEQAASWWKEHIEVSE